MPGAGGGAALPAAKHARLPLPRALPPLPRAPLPRLPHAVHHPTPQHAAGGLPPGGPPSPHSGGRGARRGSPLHTSGGPPDAPEGRAPPRLRLGPNAPHDGTTVGGYAPPHPHSYSAPGGAPPHGPPAVGGGGAAEPGGRKREDQTQLLPSPGGPVGGRWLMGPPGTRGASWGASCGASWGAWGKWGPPGRSRGPTRRNA